MPWQGSGLGGFRRGWDFFTQYFTEIGEQISIIILLVVDVKSIDNLKSCYMNELLSEMQLASSLSGLDAQDKSPPGQSSTNSGWDKVFEDSGASQGEEELEDAMTIEPIFAKNKKR